MRSVLLLMVMCVVCVVHVRSAVVATASASDGSNVQLCVPEDTQPNQVCPDETSPDEAPMDESQTITIAADCSGVAGSSDVYLIQPVGASEPFPVYCELDARGGGWTVIQNRFDGRMAFDKPWRDYKLGFGNVGAEYWLGLEKIHLLTRNEINELVIELEDFCEKSVYAHYGGFVLGPEDTFYTLQYVNEYSGNAGDALMSHAGYKFSTVDCDNDAGSEHCAQSFPAGWWFTNCFHSNLNGIYYNETEGRGKSSRIAWNFWDNHPLKTTRMMVRPRSSARQKPVHEN